MICTKMYNTKTMNEEHTDCIGEWETVLKIKNEQQINLYDIFVSNELKGFLETVDRVVDISCIFEYYINI